MSSPRASPLRGGASTTFPLGAELPWLYGVARRVLANQRRGADRRARLVTRLRAGRGPRDEEAPGSDGAVHAALAQLGAAAQEILRLAAWEGLSTADIAVTLGCTPNAAALRLSRARRCLRNAMTGIESTGHHPCGRSPMPEADDELERLHAVDPVDMASLPSVTDPKARDLFERITMTDIDANTTTARRRPFALAAAAAVVVALAGGAIVVGNSDDGDDPATVAVSPDAASQDTVEDIAGGTSDAPITPGGTSTGNCVELYSLETLTNREHAFDGTVQRVDGDQVSFSVNRWYSSGDTPTEITLAGADTLNGPNSAGPAAALEPGTWLLVAGDGGFAWSCGFTQPFDTNVASQWAQTLAG